MLQILILVKRWLKTTHLIVQSTMKLFLTECFNAYIETQTVRTSIKKWEKCLQNILLESDILGSHFREIELMKMQISSKNFVEQAILKITILARLQMASLESTSVLYIAPADINGGGERSSA